MRLLASSNILIAGSIIFGFGCVSEGADSPAILLGKIVLSIGGVAFLVDYVLSFTSGKNAESDTREQSEKATQ